MNFPVKNLLIVFLFFSMPVFADSVQSDFPLVKKGVLDLSETNLDSIERIRLDGEWEFYWNSFLSAEDFKNENIDSKQEFIIVPGSWTYENSYPARGYATFRMHIKGLFKNNIYSLYLPDMVSNYRIWIDGKEFPGNGTVSQVDAESKPQFLPKTVSFETNDSNVEILLHISNYNYRKSGIWRSLYFGKHDSIHTFREMKVILETFLISVLFAISLFHLGIFVYSRKEKSEFLFGLICLSFIVRIMSTGEQLLTSIFPLFSWEILRKMEYIPHYVSAPLLALFLSSLFPEEASKIITRIYVGICLLLGIFIMIFPIRITNYTIWFQQIVLLVGIVYALAMITKAILNKREYSVLIMTAVVIFSLTVINDILYSNQFVQTMYISPLGFIIFIIIQSQMLMRKFIRSFAQRDILVKSRDKFKHASITDSLTGLYNMRFIEQTLSKEIYNSMENDSPLSVIMADVDNFKMYNDTWGHKQGDIVLKKIAHILKSSARDNDSPCRYGGEEFSIILPETYLQEAADVSERIRQRFESAEDADKRMHGITVSIGVAQFVPGESADNLIERADKALYEAKHNGKNRVELAK